jgi:hypothetical protein
MQEEFWLGRAAFISILILIFTGVPMYFFVENFTEAIIFIIVALIIYNIATYLILYFKAESRSRAVEKVLPNLLHLVAANLNSGMTPFQAFRQASRPEFGILREEVDRAIALSLSTMQFHEALMDMSTRIKSQMLRDVIELFIEGMRTGGPLAVLLSDIAADITEELDLKKEVTARTRSYILFIAFIVVLGTPLLSAVSVHFIRTITELTEEVLKDIPEIQNVGGISFGQLTLSAEFIFAISIFNITVTALVASWLLAIISAGKDRYLIKYALVLVPLALILFFAFDQIIQVLLVIEP